MREVVADTEDGKPVLRLRCPECTSTVEQSYGLHHGAKVTCPECRESILFTFSVERVEP